MGTATNHTIEEIVDEINEDTSGWSDAMAKRMAELNKLAADFMSVPSSGSFAPGSEWIGTAGWTDGTNTFSAEAPAEALLDDDDDEFYNHVRDKLFG